MATQTDTAANEISKSSEADRLGPLYVSASRPDWPTGLASGVVVLGTFEVTDKPVPMVAKRPTRATMAAPTTKTTTTR